MDQPPLCTWRHFVDAIIICGVRWSLHYALSYRDDEALLRDPGVAVDHTTVLQWGQRDAPELNKRCRPHLTTTNGSYRVAETSMKIMKPWYSLYRTVDSTGQTLDFLLRKPRCHSCRALLPQAPPGHAYAPRVLTVDKHAASPPAFETLQQEENSQQTGRSDHVNT